MQKCCGGFGYNKRYLGRCCTDRQPEAWQQEGSQSRARGG